MMYNVEKTQETVFYVTLFIEKEKDKGIVCVIKATAAIIIV